MSKECLDLKSDDIGNGNDLPSLVHGHAKSNQERHLSRQSDGLQKGHHRRAKSEGMQLYLQSKRRRNIDYNPVRLSATTYSRDHHPNGVKYERGHFTWTMNAGRQAKNEENAHVSRRRSANIPGYRQYLKHGDLPFACWLLLCCGLCVPCCCFCYDPYKTDCDMNGNEEYKATKPLITRSADQKPTMQPNTYNSVANGQVKVNNEV